MTSPSLLMKTWNLRPRKEMGQNFLTDRGIAQKIVNRSNITANDVVVEIGAGLGSLTIPMAHIAKSVYAIEKDPALLAPLQSELQKSALDNVAIINKNILDLDLSSVVQDEECSPIIMGNIPYNISSQILVRIMTNRQSFKHAALMFQKEMALRIMASPGTKDYGRLAVMTAHCSTVSILTEVKANQFYPKPNIDSLVLGFNFKEPDKTLKTDELFLFKVVKAAFSKRRKTLKNSLAGPILGIDSKASITALRAVDIDPSRRAETLAVDEFVRLANFLAVNS